MVESIARTTLESMLEGRQALIGTPEEVVEQLAYQIEVFGEIEPSMQINFGGIGDEEALRTLELFADRVMPRFST
jgi:alkanesulfonate monooxygenase SsuD/methylene tetrahydromethanopterin reductase-like flavin-dependent oxidoreductase (luciferase family)